MGLLDPFATQSKKSNIIMIKLDIWLKFYHGWVGIVAYIEWLIKLEYWKLKCEIKDLLFIAFQQKKPQNLYKPGMSS